MDTTVGEDYPEVPLTLVLMDIYITHLHYPTDIDRELNETDPHKVLQYRPSFIFADS